MSEKNVTFVLWNVDVIVLWKHFETTEFIWQSENEFAIKNQCYYTVHIWWSEYFTNYYYLPFQELGVWDVLFKITVFETLKKYEAFGNSVTDTKYYEVLYIELIFIKWYFS